MNSTRPVIRAEGLTKSFTIHTESASTLKEMVVKGLAHRGSKSTFTAIHDLSFELMPGRSLAIVGHNGSGKSTLLKLIAGISQPSGGRIEVHGRIAALLELGAGFHGDLTGMENIFLQGSLLGLSRGQILDRLDEVLDFCELGPFIHTPMKRYSSGMTVRLGFALAVFFEAETLLIDEVLSVGDSAFQAKCLRKIMEMRQEGRTILFVSHMLAQVEDVAEQVLWLDHGRRRAVGPPEDIIPRYLQDLHQAGERQVDEVKGLNAGKITEKREYLLAALSPAGSQWGGEKARIEEVRLLDDQGNPCEYFESGASLQVAIRFTALETLEAVQVELGYTGFDELKLGRHGNELQDGPVLRNVKGTYLVKAAIRQIPFHPRRYRLSVALSNPFVKDEYYDIRLESFTLQIVGKRAPGDVSTVLPPGHFPGNGAGTGHFS